MKVDVLCCGEWCRKWLEGRLKFDMLWGFRRIFVKLIVLKILTVVSCEEGGFVGFGLLERTSFMVGSGNLYCGECFVLQGVVPKVIRKMAEIWRVVVDWTRFGESWSFCLQKFCQWLLLMKMVLLVLFCWRKRFLWLGQGISTVVIALWYAEWFRNLFGE